MSAMIPKRRKRLNQIAVAPYLFLLPNLVIFSLFIIYPTISGFLISLTNKNAMSPYFDYIGLSNYVKLFHDAAYWKTLLATMRYAIFMLPLLFFVPLLLALLLQWYRHGKSVARAIIYWPTLISPIIIGLLWKWMLGDKLGLFNHVLRQVGLEPVKWLTDPTMANISLMAATLWSSAGSTMVIFEAGILNISQSYYEAARMDGAGRFKMFTSITLPLLKPTSVLIMILNIIGTIKVYPLAFALNKGGPGRTTTFIVQFIYDMGFTRSQMGYASAMSFVLFIIICILTIVMFKANKGGDYLK